MKSTFPSLQCARVPEADAATIWLASVAAATVGGIPIIIRRGVMRNPPPTPNRPDKSPTSSPRPTTSQRLTLVKAIGK